MLIHNLARLVNYLTYYKKEFTQLPYSILCQTVKQTEEYHHFIPWCKHSEIIQKISQRQNYTRLTISFNDLKQISYTSHVEIDQSQQSCTITSTCKDSPLKYLKSVWIIAKKTQDTSCVDYSLDFEFDSLVYQLTSSLFLNIMGKSMWDIFLARAHAINQSPTNKSKSKFRHNNGHTLAQTNLCRNLQDYLSKRPNLRKLMQVNKQLQVQIWKIDKRLAHTSNYTSKMNFEIRNILTHYNIQMNPHLLMEFV